MTGTAFCDFVIFTKKDLYRERILPDNPFQQLMLDKLSVFYASHGMPYLVQN